MIIKLMIKVMMMIDDKGVNDKGNDDNSDKGVNDKGDNRRC